jgi:hypothetical protein
VFHKKASLLEFNTYKQCTFLKKAITLGKKTEGRREGRTTLRALKLERRDFIIHYLICLVWKYIKKIAITFCDKKCPGY